MTCQYSQPDRDRDGPQDCGAFFLDAVGPYGRPQVHVAWRDQDRPSDPAVETLIERFWVRCTAQAQRDGSPLWDGPLCRLIGYRSLDLAALDKPFDQVQGGPTDKALELTLGPTNYRAFVGTNLHNAHLRYLHGPEVLANPLGVSANVIVGGPFIVFGKRSMAVAYHGGRIHPIGGCLEPHPPDPPPHPFDSMVTEMREELGAGPEQIGELVCLGLVRDKHIVQPELIFDAHLDTTVEEVRARSATAGGGSEHTELVIVRDHPVSVVTFIESHYSQLTPVALAGLLLHGLHHWGSGWFASTRGYLRTLI